MNRYELLHSVLGLQNPGLNPVSPAIHTFPQLRSPPSRDLPDFHDLRDDFLEKEKGVRERRKKRETYYYYIHILLSRSPLLSLPRLLENRRGNRANRVY